MAFVNRHLYTVTYSIVCFSALVISCAIWD